MLPVLFLVACAPADGALVVELRTDYVVGTEVAEVQTVLRRDDGVVARADVAAATDAFEGQRIAEFGGIHPGSYLAEVALLDPSGETTASRTIAVEFQHSLAVTAVITRSCQGVLCPEASDPAATECLGGRCVDPSCTPETPELCGAPSCATDEECAPSSCEEAVCYAGTCLLRSAPGLCPAGTPVFQPAVRIEEPTDGMCSRVCGLSPDETLLVMTRAGAGSCLGATDAVRIYRWDSTLSEPMGPELQRISPPPGWEGMVVARLFDGAPFGRPDDWLLASGATTSEGNSGLIGFWIPRDDPTTAEVVPDAFDLINSSYGRVSAPACTGAGTCVYHHWHPNDTNPNSGRVLMSASTGDITTGAPGRSLNEELGFPAGHELRWPWLADSGLELYAVDRNNVNLLHATRESAAEPFGPARVVAQEALPADVGELGAVSVSPSGDLLFAATTTSGRFNCYLARPATP